MSNCGWWTIREIFLTLICYLGYAKNYYNAVFFLIHNLIMYLNFRLKRKMRYQGWTISLQGLAIKSIPKDRTAVSPPPLSPSTSRLAKMKLVLIGPHKGFLIFHWSEKNRIAWFISNRKTSGRQDSLVKTDYQGSDPQEWSRSDQHSCRSAGAVSQIRSRVFPGIPGHWTKLVFSVINPLFYVVRVKVKKSLVSHYLRFYWQMSYLGSWCVFLPRKLKM